MKRIKTTLWYYDFTRMDTAWNRKIPYVTILNNTKWRKPTQYWSRTFVEEYMPIVEKHDLVEYLSDFGYETTTTCVYGKNRCEGLDDIAY